MQAEAADSPARPENSTAVLEKRVSTICSHLIVSKEALKLMPSVCLRAF
jgi:hypothetical protein